MDIGQYQAVGSFFDKYISYSQARAMQNDMNEYNDPKHMVGRMQQAGLSPWNYSGDGNTAAQPVISESKLAENLGAIADRKMAKRQLDIQENLSNAQAEQTRSLTETNRTLLKYLDESERERIDNMKAGTGNLNASTAEIAKRVSRYDQQIDADISLKKANEAFQYAQTDSCKASTNRINRLLAWEIKETRSRISLNRSQVAVLKTQANLNDVQIANVTSMFIKNMEEVDRVGLENWMLSYQKEIIQKTGIKPGTPPWTALTDMFARIRRDLGSNKSDRGSW